MRYVLLLLFIAFSNNINAQEEITLEKPTAEKKYETFEMTEGDSTYLMKKYYMAFLKSGPNRDHSKEEAAEIQKGHMAHMGKLAAENKIQIAGPFDDDSDIQGVVIYSVYSLEEALTLTQADPAVVAGRLVVELHPFWAAKGSKLD